MFFVRYRVGGGRRAQQRWLKLGAFTDAYSVEDARRDARRLLGEARAGKDPAGSREDQRAEPVFADVAKRFLEEYAPAHKKPSSIRMDKINLRLYLQPAFRTRRISRILRRDVEALKVKLREKPGTANRVLALLSKIMNLAEIWGYREENSNPCRGVRRFPEHRRERFVSQAERQRLEGVLQQAENLKYHQEGYVSPGAIAAIRLLALTGARLGEILSLEWDDVDFERGALCLRDSKTGPRSHPLTPQAITYLRALASRQTSNLVAPSESGGRQQNIQSIWRRVRTMAKMEDVNLHALRHSWVSDAVEAGVPLAIVGQIMGHRSVQTTLRYAHLCDAAQTEALRRAGLLIAKKSRSKPRAV